MRNVMSAIGFVLLVMTVLSPYRVCAEQQSEKATIYVMRQSGVGPGSLAPLYINGLLISALKYKTYVCYEADPGKVKLASFNGLSYYAELAIDVIPGQAYYVELSMWVGLEAGYKLKYELLDREEGRSRLANCKPVVH